MNSSRYTIPAIMLLTILALRAGAQETSIVLREGLGLPSVGRYGRGPTHTDSLEAQIVAGRWTFPKVGDTVLLPDGSTRKWTRLEANKDGTFSGPALRGGYAAFEVECAHPEVRMLEASGHDMVYVNGEPRVGDVYSTGWTIVPVELKAGRNTLMFHGGRGTLSAKLTVPEAAVFFNTRDLTLPDLVVGEQSDMPGAVIVVNGSEKTLRNRFILCSGPGLVQTRTPVPPIPPLTFRKVQFYVRGAARPGPGSCEITLIISGRSEPAAAKVVKAELRVRKTDETRKITFVSAIDGSVQYYAVNPARPKPGSSSRLALVLSLHGAGVEAIGQADAYAGKTWANIVAPTNRRPYGFDWEDWGRLDALEVLGLAKARYRPDTRRIYLTGHSMGGHGTWHIGVTYPAQFAAIGVSAGWISLFSYAGASRPPETSNLQSFLMRPMQPSDTLSLMRNYAQEGVYILHGDADDNVPVTEAREMKTRLTAFHSDVKSWEQPGAGHWWGGEQTASDEHYGAACVDWKPMFEFFAAHRRPVEADIRDIDFTTADPGVSAWSDWTGIMAQEYPFQVSRVQFKYDRVSHRFSGATENVLRLSLRPGDVGGTGRYTITIDGQTVQDSAVGSRAKQIWLIKRAGNWELEDEPDATDKRPERCGPFKQAFRHRMVLVYGTQGTAEENAWSYVRARYDAESFWYRGNGSLDLVADTTFRSSADRDRSVILYGNADTNGAWKHLLAGSPIVVTRSGITVGDRQTAGSDLACLFVRPRPGSAIALVAAVSGTGLSGMRLTERIPYFTSGVEFPDCVVFRSDMLIRGAGGVVAAGFFGPDWSLARGEFVWQ